MWQKFDRVNAWGFARYNPTQNVDLEMEKLPVLIMVLEMTLSLAACGGNNDAPASTPEASVPVA